MAQVTSFNQINSPSGSLYGKVAPPLSANTAAAAARRTATAEIEAIARERRLLNRRFDMPGSFRCQGADSEQRVSSSP